MELLSTRILDIFREMRSDRLDLHILFEAGENDSSQRENVLDALDNLVRQGLVKELGSDFYELTEQGRVEAGRAT